MSRRSALWLAVFGSFVVYAVPILGVHGGVGVGLALMGAFYEGLSLWLVLVLGVAVLLQLGAAVALFGLFRGPNWRRFLGFAVSVPLFYFAVQIAYLRLIPMLLLVEADRAPEVGEVEVRCTVEDAWLASVRSGTGLGLEEAAEAWVAFGEDRQLGLLTLPGCRVSPIPGTRTGMSDALVAPGGHVVFQPGSGSGDQSGFLHMRPGLDGPVVVMPPPGIEYWLPVLSDEGQAAGWLRRHQTEAGGSEWRVHTRDLASGAERSVVLDQPSRAQLTLLAFRDDGEEYTLSRYPNELLVLDGDGLVAGAPVRPEGMPLLHNVRRHDGGWVAWDSYRNGRERSRVVWSLPGGSGFHEVPLGRDITSVSVQPGGRLIAVSTTRSVSVGEIDDAVFVLRTADGSEVYRRRRPAYTRTRLAFLGADALALSPGFADRGGIDVVRFEAW